MAKTKWQQQLKKALLDTIARTGTPVIGPMDGVPGFTAPWDDNIVNDWRYVVNVVRESTIDYGQSEMEEAQWYEGGDTFNEGTTVSGLRATVKFVEFGELFYFQWDRSLAELILAVCNAD